MGYSVVRREKYEDGSVLTITLHQGMYVANISKVKSNSVETEYIWEYEAKSLQSVSKWVNKVRKSPLPHKYYENGVWFLPHNNRFGNPDGKRRKVFSGAITEDTLQ